MEEDKVIGTLNVYNISDEFPENDVEFLQTFANQCAIYIRNAQLFGEVIESAERIKQEMEITTHLLQISEATAHTTDIDKLMGQVVHCSQTIIGCDVCLSYLWDKEVKVFQPNQAYGLAHEMVPLFRTGPLDEEMDFVRKAMEGRGPVVIPPPPDASGGGGNFLPWLEDIQTMAIIPLMGKEDPLGLLIVIYKTPRGFTERDNKIMEGIFHQLSIALEEARLYRESTNKAMELSHKVETIQMMHEIDRNILSTLESGEVLETVTRMVGKVIPCDRVTIVLVDKERQGFIYKAGFGVTLVPKGAFVPFGDTSTTEVVSSGRPQYVANLACVKELLPLEKKLLEEGFLSHIRVPLMVKGEIIGTLNVGATRPSAFTPDDLSTLEYIASQIGIALENARLIGDLEELFLGTVKAFSMAIDAKSPWTAGHSERVTRIALDTGREMGLDGEALRVLEIAGLLHDIGKLGTYEAILDKPERLTDDESELIRQHPGKGAEILSPIKQLKDIIPVIRHHHEFYNGEGYPDGLKGEEIPLMARILAVADTVDAMGSDRPYRKGKSMDEIVEELERCSGIQFDPKVVETFLKTGVRG